METMYTLFGVATMFFAILSGIALIVRASRDNNN
jgi:hypothetical protein